VPDGCNHRHVTALGRIDDRKVHRAPATLALHRQSLGHVWRPAIGALPSLGARHSTLLKVADSHSWKKKTYNNAISALRRAFEFGYRHYTEKRDPAAALKSARIGKNDRPE
jgi:hypothetical protein